MRRIFYAVYRGIPFLWELRAVLDWTFTPTTLTLDEWLKIEDVADIVYQRRCRIDDERDQPPLERQSKANKATGLVRVLVILGVLLIPLFIYSDFSTNTRTNSITSMSLELSLLVNNTPYTIVEGVALPEPEVEVVDYSASRKPGWLERWNDRTKPRPILLPPWVDASINHQNISLTTSCSRRLWDISPSAWKDLNLTLATFAANQQAAGWANSPAPGAIATMVATATFTRAYAIGGSTLTPSLQWSYPLTSNQTMQFADSINGVLPVNAPVQYIDLPEFYTPMVTNTPTMLETTPGFAQSIYGFRMNCSIVLNNRSDFELSGVYTRYWCIRCGARPMTDAAKFVHMSFVALSQPVPIQVAQLLSGIGIITLYTTFVLAIGRFLRSMFADAAHHIILAEMADPREVYRLLAYIAMSRGRGEWTLERGVYRQLVDLLRSPETLLKVTGRLVTDNGSGDGGA